MIDISLAAITVAFAILYAVSRTDEMRFLAKYLFLFGVIITGYEIGTLYITTQAWLVYVIGVFIFLLVFMLDFILWWPTIIAAVRRLWR